MQELHSRAQGELSIREALKELELWGSKAAFNLSSFEDSQQHTVQIIRGWSDIIQEVCTSLCERWRRGVGGEVKYSINAHGGSCFVIIHALHGIYAFMQGMSTCYHFFLSDVAVIYLPLLTNVPCRLGTTAASCSPSRTPPTLPPSLTVSNCGRGG